MICPNYSELSHFEKKEFIGKLQHAIMSNDNLFNMAADIIECAKEKGLFNGVEISCSLEQPEYCRCV